MMVAASLVQRNGLGQLLVLNLDESPNLSLEFGHAGEDPVRIRNVTPVVKTGNQKDTHLQPLRRPAALRLGLWDERSVRC